MKQRTKKAIPQFVNVMVNGQTVPVYPNGIKSMTRISGETADGTKVNSLHVHQIGDTTFISQGTGKPAIPYKTADLAVMAAGIFSAEELAGANFVRTEVARF